VEVRVYDAPKSDTIFVSGPNAGGSQTLTKNAGRPSAPAAAGPKRILGAVIPMESGCYFLKATDSPDRLQPLMADFANIVADFQINPSTGKPDMSLPSGWTMNPRNDIAMAEFVSPDATGNVKFTVTVLGMPPASEWQSYLLSNINRWRGQLQLPDIDIEAMKDELISVNRSSSLLPGYIFDAQGNGSGSMTGAPAAPSAPSPPSVANTPRSADTPPSTAPPSDSESKKPELVYQLPDGWQSAPGSPFRLATFGIQSPDGEGEVTVSMAVDNPSSNTLMWYQQVSKESDPTKLQSLAESTIAKSEKFSAELGEGVLYTIRDSEQIDAPMLLVASLPSPREDLHVFVKLRGDAKLVESQRANMMQFVQTLQLK
jgi:hypothetical protein